MAQFYHINTITYLPRLRCWSDHKPRRYYFIFAYYLWWETNNNALFSLMPNEKSTCFCHSVYFPLYIYRPQGNLAIIIVLQQFYHTIIQSMWKNIKFWKCLAKTNAKFRTFMIYIHFSHFTLFQTLIFNEVMIFIY